MTPATSSMETTMTCLFPSRRNMIFLKFSLSLQRSKYLSGVGTPVPQQKQFKIPAGNTIQAVYLTTAFSCVGIERSRVANLLNTTLPQLVTFRMTR